MQGDLVTISGDRYLKVRHVNIMPEVRDMKAYASNLFTGSEELGEYQPSLVRPPCGPKEHSASVFRDVSYLP